MGTCKSEAELAEAHGVSEETVLEACAENEVIRCEGCSWWCEQHEMEDRDGQEFCEDCRD
jgi:hypothetical protein